jgi:glycosyltransferase involved in cell wall biosynthesis
MSKRKVLYVVHNHPSVRPGGAEAYALELYEGMRESGSYEPIFVAKGGPPISEMRAPHAGTRLARVNTDPNQYFFHTEGFDYDWLNGTSRNKDIYVRHWADFLAACRPDIVHFQHTLFFGYDILRQTRNSLPDAPIVYTLHEYLPICHREGQMLRTNNELCSEESPRRCHECFPNVSPQDFFLRKRFIQSQLALVDRFLTPSHFLRRRYIEWGLPPEHVEFEEVARRVPPPPAEETEPDRPRTRIGFFGQFTFFKGVHVLLKAMQHLSQASSDSRTNSFGQRTTAGDAGRPEVHCWLHGANLELQPGEYQNEFRSLVESTKRHVTFAGRYRPEEIGRLMQQIDWVVIPSIWWENSPLVIQEAFMHGRPVICSDIGGMAEKVVHERNGLHFRTGDPMSLAAAIRRAVEERGLWEKLRQGIGPVYRIEDSVAKLTNLYDTLIDQKQRHADRFATARPTTN